MAFISGLIGRFLVRQRLPHIASMPVLQEVIGLVGQFDDWLVIRGSQLTLITGVLLGAVGHWPYVRASHPTWIFVALLLFLSLLPVVFFVFIPRGKQFGKTFQVAVQEQRITPELRLALADPTIRAATVYEAVVTAIILYLMVLKPF
jgi:hypothetical protein